MCTHCKPELLDSRGVFPFTVSFPTLINSVVGDVTRVLLTFNLDDHYERETQREMADFSPNWSRQSLKPFFPPPDLSSQIWGTAFEIHLGFCS